MRAFLTTNRGRIRACAATAAAAFLLLSSALAAQEVRLNADTAIAFASAEEAAKLLAVRDDFVKAMGPFDRSARLKTDKDVTEQEFLAFVSRQALAWEDGERKRISGIVEGLKPALAALKPAFPKTVTFVKTTGNEEGNAAYTRGEAIFLPRQEINFPDDHLRRTILHELFHILIRRNPDLRDELCRIIGFIPCGEVALPAELTARKITDPDGVRNDHRISVFYQGKPVEAVPVLFSSTERYDPARGGEFFEYLEFQLLAVEKTGDRWQPVRRNGKPVILDPAQVSGFVEKIGANTDYVIHPEEILADNFTLLVLGEKDVPTPRVLSEMRKVLIR